MEVLKNVLPVIKHNKSLLLYTILDLCAVLAIFIGYWRILITHCYGVRMVIVMTMLWLFATYSVSLFFSVALYSETFEILKGRHVSLFRGIALASRRVTAIIIWSIFSAVVCTVIRNLESHIIALKTFVYSAIGVSCSVAMSFVIPSIIYNKRTINPITHLQNAANIIISIWGEGKNGLLGTYAFTFIAALIVGILCFGAVIYQMYAIIWQGATFSIAQNFLPVMILIFILILIAVVSKLFIAIYICCLYYDAVRTHNI